MSSVNHNYSLLDAPLPSAEDMQFGIVVAEWNPEITSVLAEGAVQTFLDAGCPRENITVKQVPGTVELTLGAQYFAEFTKVDAVVVLGCVIQGDTRHFDYVCDSVTQGITTLSIQYNLPIGFGVLTVNNMQQALDRCGGVLGNKGSEAAATVIKMVDLKMDMMATAIEEDLIDALDEEYGVDDSDPHNNKSLS
ncbi:MAG: 6,7-dimethyl-8-ribityllumazine synthase [Rikenellaceae bacterium]